MTCLIESSDSANKKLTDNLEILILRSKRHHAAYLFFAHVIKLENKQMIHFGLFKGEEKVAVALNTGADSWCTYSSQC